MAASASAQTTSAGQLAGARGFFALPVELDMDYGAANGDAIILRIQPLYTFPVADTWKLVHLDTFTLADAPGGIPEFPGGQEMRVTSGASRICGTQAFLHRIKPATLSGESA